MGTLRNNGGQKLQIQTLQVKHSLRHTRFSAWTLFEALLGPWPLNDLGSGAKCLPSWPPSPEIRTAHAKFTAFHVCVLRISACVDLVSPPEKGSGARWPCDVPGRERVNVRGESADSGVRGTRQ